MVLLKRVTAGTLRTHNRLTALLWCAGWTIPLAILGLAVSLPFWRAAVTETTIAVAQQVDYEDGALCSKFGFSESTSEQIACKFDLLDLRRRHEELVAATSLP
jgi:hypothetical protein